MHESSLKGSRAIPSDKRKSRAFKAFLGGPRRMASESLWKPRILQEARVKMSFFSPARLNSSVPLLSGRGFVAAQIILEGC